MSESITGYIDHIIFRNGDNGYTVMVLKGVSEEDELTCVGSFPVVTQGASVELEGNFTQHPVYGKQFQAVRLTEKMPEDALPNKVLLPVLSNQKMNSYLKEIGDLCGIDKNLTFHLARHTFATTITLAKGVPIETVSKMLGHTNIQTTQIYARITNSKISNDMEDLAGKLGNVESVYNKAE